MKTAEEKAKEYADSIHPAYVPETIVENTVADLNKFAQTDYLSGYAEAMRWKDPKVELPEEGIDVLLKCEKSFPPYHCYLIGNQCDGVFYSNETCLVLEKVIGWKSIE